MPNKVIRNRLFMDIETSPNVVLSWDTGYNLTIHHANILRERAIICICWKWEGEKKVHSLSWDKNQCDKKMLQDFIEVMNSADEIVAHNGASFDLKWISTRCLFHRIDSFPSYVNVDTLKQAKKYFRFNSNALDYITKYLGLKGKDKTNFDMWKQILINKDAKTLKAMVKYCSNDVVQLEQMFNIFKKYTDVKTNFASHISSCPECGSGNVHVRSYKITAQGHQKVQFQCQEVGCGKYHTIAGSRFTKGTSI